MSANLHKWIDLIFGYKQKGEEALVNHNVFHHLFYEGAVDIDKIEDPMKKNAAISFIHNFGQMPKQVLSCVLLCIWFVCFLFLRALHLYPKSTYINFKNYHTRLLLSASTGTLKLA